MVQQSFDFPGTPRLTLDEWAALLRSTCGGDHRVGEPNAFAGWMRQLNVYGVAAAAIKIRCGIAAVDHGGASYRYERTRRDVRFADTDWYCALFPVAGRSWLTQNDQTIQLDVGDIGLLDGAKPSTRLSEKCAWAGRRSQSRQFRQAWQSLTRLQFVDNCGPLANSRPPSPAGQKEQRTPRCVSSLDAFF